MISVVGIGANVHDTVIVLPEYPAEDTKLRAKSKMSCGGGPCGTGLVAASKLGADVAYIGNVTDDESGRFLISDFERYGVSTEYMTELAGYASFVSYVMLSEKNATRTIVFDKGNVPALKLNDKQIRAIESARVLMVDGNDLESAIEGAKIAQKSGTKVLYDAGGLYEGVEELLPLCDIIIPSKEFSLGITGEKDAESAAKKIFQKYSPEIVVITCGSDGGIMYDGVEIKKYSAFPVEAVDSNGAGDVFHGAYAFAVTKGFDYYTACVFSSAVSALKCTHIGSRAGVPDYKSTIEFLKERGINEFEKTLE